jgi:hypothetical protein
MGGSEEYSRPYCWLQCGRVRVLKPTIRFTNRVTVIKVPVRDLMEVSGY